MERTVAAIQRGIDEGAHVGAVLRVLRGGDVVADVAMGLARPGVAMTPETLVPWLSCTKPLIAVAALQLWERGALALDAPVAAYVPEFGVNGKGAVTVRHLLTHTGGFPNAEGDLAAVCAASLEADWVPGRRAAYHARGAFLVLGEVIRRVDGRAIEAYVSEEILEPLDLGDTWLTLTPERYRAYGDRVAVLYDTTDPNAPRPRARLEQPDGYEPVHAAGSVIGPVGELAGFFDALSRRAGAGVLSKEGAEAMTARHRAGLVDETFGQIIDWGLGVMVNSWHYRKRSTSYGYGERAGWRAFGHGGAQSALAFADPEHDLAVAIACNGTPGEARNHRRTQRIVKALYEDLGL